MKKIFSIAFSFLLFAIGVKSFPDDSALIIPLNLEDKDTIDLGFTLPGVKQSAMFLLRNSSSSPIRLSDVDPSFYLGQPDAQHPDDFKEFRRSIDNIIDLPPGTELEFGVSYVSDKNLVTYPLGDKYALLKLGLYNPQTHPLPGESDLIASKRYILKCVKTLNEIEQKSTEIRFDSVYVNPRDTARAYWTLQNADTLPHKLLDVNFNYLSPRPVGSEIHFEDKIYPFDFPAERTAIDWRVSYYPLDAKKDSAEINAAFKPDEINYPDSIKYLKAKVIGTGVLQKIDLLESDGIISGDTIDLGDIRTGTEKNFYLVFRNSGNIPFGALMQSIFQAEEDLIRNDAAFTKYLRANPAHLQPEAIDTVRFKIFPTQRGSILARMVFESDIHTRAIKGYQSSERKITYWLKARAVEPIIGLPADTIDFGSIVIRPDCPDSRDSLIFLANNGNLRLEISSVEINPPPPGPFSISPSFGIIDPGERKAFSISFSTDGQPVGSEFLATLTVKSDCPKPMNEVKIALKAAGAGPGYAEISAPDVKAKPGTTIAIPIISEKTKIKMANSFSADLIYDASLMKYKTRKTIGTAVEGAEYIGIDEDADGGKLKLNIFAPKGSGARFLERDTLITLYFDTYLGAAVSAPVAISSPLFGDDICDDIINLTRKNGSFTLDSICGLEFKALPGGFGASKLGSPAPYPAADKVKISFNNAFPGNVLIRLFSADGSPVSDLISAYLPAGEYSLDYDCSGLTPGLYFCEFTRDGFRTVQTLIVAR